MPNISTDLPNAINGQERSPATSLASARLPGPSPQGRQQGNNSGSGNGSAPGSQVTIEAALANANGDPMVALEMILSERNTLSSQNSQLWKIIEKQRSMVQHTNKELDRIRAERDRLQGKSSETAATSRRPSADEASPRAKVHRSQSEDNGPTRSPASVASRPSDPTDVVEPPPVPSPSETLATRPNRGASLPSAEAKAHHIPSSVPAPIPAPDATTTTTTPIPPPVRPPPPPPPVAPVAPVAVFTAEKEEGRPKPAVVAYDPPALPPPQASQTQLLTANVSPAPNTMLSPIDQSARRRAARESRITLPDEAAHYIQNMQESPVPSPKPRVNDVSPAQEPPPAVEVSAPPAVAPQPEPNWTASARTPARPAVEDNEGGQFYDAQQPASHLTSTHRKPIPLSTETTEFDEVLPEPPRTQGRLRVANATEFDDPDTPTPVASQMPVRPPYLQNPSEISLSQASTMAIPPRSNLPSSDEVPQVPYPYSTSPQAYGQVPPSNYPVQSNGYNPNDSYSSIGDDLSSFQSQTGPTSYASPITPQQPSQQMAFPPSATQTPSRLPTLSPVDLAYTRVRVNGSNIRSNDRGKDVLTFLINVQPAQKEAWVVEKMYSDVLSLDSRIRSGLSKSNMKRLLPLPDSKLFKDNAPAKVDLRRNLLEQYLQAAIQAPLKDVGDLCAFFSSDLQRSDRAPQASQGYKEGYLTKRGKNFGGWKTRFFVLQNGLLEYYDNRGGNHLGAINITGSQIGRQQKQAAPDDENAYRHAFLIIEAKKGPSGSNVRHVLCASSDEDRDSWVETLVRHVVGNFDEALSPAEASGPNVPRPSMSSVDIQSRPLPVEKRPRAMSNNETTRGSAALNPSDTQNAKLFAAPPPPSDDLSIGARSGQSLDRAMGMTDAQLALRMLDRGQGAAAGSGSSSPSMSVSSSLPSSLDSPIAQGPPPLSATSFSTATPGTPQAARSNSEMGYHAEIRGQISDQRVAPPKPRVDKNANRTSYHPSLATVNSSPPPSATAGPGDSKENRTIPRPPSPENKKISGPKNATPIPPGGWGAKEESPVSDRDRKARSTRFWGFGGRSQGTASSSDKEKGASGPSLLVPGGFSRTIDNSTGRAVFGIPLESALAVAQIANLPAIVFRCIQYLEAKHSDEEEGIYRLSGSSAVIKSLKDRFNMEGDIDLLKHDEYWDPHAIAGLLKLFLRDLPTSLLTRELQQRFLGVVDLMNHNERVAELAQLICQLPVANYSLLRALTAHLIKIVQNNTVNKMNIRNMGIVFSPTLQVPAGIFSLMLSDFKAVFNVDAADGESDVSSEAHGSSTNGTRPPEAAESKMSLSSTSHEKPNKRNSTIYAHTSADQMLGLGGRQLEAPDESDEGEVIAVPEEDDSDSDISYEDIRAPPKPYVNGAPASNPAAGTTVRVQPPPEDTDGQGASSQRTHSAKAIASTKGLHIATNGLDTDAKRKRMSGLPTSPRPMRAPTSPAVSNESR